MRLLTLVSILCISLNRASSCGCEDDDHDDQHHTYQQQLMGGFNDKVPEDCLTAFNEAKNELDYPYWSKAVIKTCKVQIVNGTNYKMEVEFQEGNIKNCELGVYKPIQGTATLFEVKGDNDCFAKIKANQAQPGEL